MTQKLWKACSFLTKLTKCVPCFAEMCPFVFLFTISVDPNKSLFCPMERGIAILVSGISISFIYLLL